MVNLAFMRVLTIICIFTLASATLAAQSAEEEVIRLKNSPGLESTGSGGDEPASREAPEGQERLEPGEGDDTESPVRERNSPWNLTVGTSFSYARGWGSGMGFYAAPAYTLPMTNRLSLHAGVVASHFSLLDAPTGMETGYYNGFSSLSLFAAASYQATERLVVHGAGVKQLVTSPASPFSSYPVDNFSLGATYRLGNNITIGASIHMRNGYGWGTGSPFGPSYGSFYSAPLGSPYASPFGW